MNQSASRVRRRSHRLLGAAIVAMTLTATTGGVTLAGAAPASADTVINGCTIVSNPTSMTFTNCPGANLAGADLSGVDLSFANLAGAQFVDCTQPFLTCDPAKLTGANLTDANLSHASLFSFIQGPFPASFGIGAANLSSANLAGADLSGADMTDVDATGATMTAINATATLLGLANLTDANLANANLTSATFTTCEILFCQGGGTLTRANLAGATLPGADLTGVTLTGATFTGANLSGTNLSETLLVPPDQSVPATSGAGAVVTWPTPPSLPGATPGACSSQSGSTFPIGGTTVTCQILDDHGNVATGTFGILVNGVATFTRIFSSTRFVQVGHSLAYTVTVHSLFQGDPTPSGGTVAFTDNGSPITGCSAVPLSGTSASCSTAPGTLGLRNINAAYSGSGIFLGAPTSADLQIIVTKTQCVTLAGCNLSGLNLANTFDLLTGADISGANLQGVVLTNSFIVGANLTHGNLQGADLSRSVLDDANLTGANLTRANLARVDLTRANLAGANATGANLSGAFLGGADLTGAILNRATLTGAVWTNTTCPDGTNSNNDGGTCLGHL